MTTFYLPLPGRCLREVRTLGLGFLLLGSVPSRSAGQETSSSPRRVGSLAPAAKEALSGVLSPNGRSFVYEVVLAEERQLWLMDILNGKFQVLTSAPGVRTEPAWSLDGRMVAYSRTQPFSREERRDDGLWVVDINTGVERLVYRSSEVGEYTYLESPSWASDSSLMFWVRADQLDLGGSGEEKAQRWTVRLDGSHAEKHESLPVGRALAVSPDGRWLASSGPCCGGSKRGILVRALGDSSARCLAGPLPPEGDPPHAWAPDSRALYFVSGSLTDSTAHAYRIGRLKDNDWSVAERIDRLRDPAASVSASRTGTIALVVRPHDSPIGDLWIIQAASKQPRPQASAVGTCPGPPAPIMALVERSSLPKVRTVDVQLELGEPGVTFFTVSYGNEMDWGVYHGATGLLYRGRVGWITAGESEYTSAEADSVERTTEWFPLRSSDTFLISKELLETLEKRAHWLSRSFRGFLARNPATPLAALRRLIQLDPRGNGVDANGRLADAATPWAELVELARLSPAVAQVVLQRADVRDNPDRVYAIAQLPEYRVSGGMQYIVRRQFRTFGPVLLSDPHTPEHMLLQLFFSMEGNSRDTGMMRALFQHRGTRHSSTLMTFFAARLFRDPPELAKQAREKLPGFGLETVDDAKRALVRRVRADSTLPAFTFLEVASMVGLDWRLLSELQQIRGRDSVAERVVREALARSRAPLPLLRELAESLRTDPQYGIAAALLTSYTAGKDRRILEIIAGLDTAKARNLPAWADSLLRTTPAGTSPK